MDYSYKPEITKFKITLLIMTQQVTLKFKKIYLWNTDQNLSDKSNKNLLKIKIIKSKQKTCLS